jgi:TolB-like protein
MPSSRLWSRIRKGRLVQVLLVYLGVSWAVVQVVDDLRSMLGLPQWIGPVTIILLAIGLFIILATAWVQSHPLVDAREEADEVPGSWELALPEAVASVKQGRLPHLTWSRALVGGVVAFSLLIGVAGLFVLIRGGDVLRPRDGAAAEAPDGIAVLPFAVRGEALDDWREGMVDLLSTGLDGAGGLRAIASRTVLARWHETVPGDVAPDESVALDVARQIGARYALMGSAVSIGPRVRIALDVYELDGANARRVGAPVQVEGHPDSVLVLVDQLGMQALALVLRDSRADLPPLDWPA